MKGWEGGRQRVPRATAEDAKPSKDVGTRSAGPGTWESYLILPLLSGAERRLPHPPHHCAPQEPCLFSIIAKAAGPLATLPNFPAWWQGGGPLELSLFVLAKQVILLLDINLEKSLNLKKGFYLESRN